MSKIKNNLSVEVCDIFPLRHFFFRSNYGEPCPLFQNAISPEADVMKSFHSVKKTYAKQSANSRSAYWTLVVVLFSGFYLIQKIEILIPCFVFRFYPPEFD